MYMYINMKKYLCIHAFFNLHRASLSNHCNRDYDFNHTPYYAIKVVVIVLFKLWVMMTGYEYDLGSLGSLCGHGSLLVTPND